MGADRDDERDLVRREVAELAQLPPGELWRAIEVHVQGSLPRLRALHGEVLREQALLRRLVAEEEEGRRPREAALEAFVEDGDPRAGPGRFRRAHVAHPIPP